MTRILTSTTVTVVGNDVRDATAFSPQLTYVASLRHCNIT